MSSPSPICPRVALIGVSGYGRIYVQLLRECQAQGRLQLAAAVVINPAEEPETMRWLAEAHCRVYPDYETMLSAEAGQLELCMVPTGIQWHARMTIAALRSGANVLVEKPLCASMAEARAIEAAALEHDRFVAVGFQDFYEPGTQWLKDHLVQGVIGTVESVRFLGLWPRARQYFRRNNWAGKLLADGAPVLDSPLSNAFAHFVMLSLFFADPQRDGVAAAEIREAELYRAHAIESFDTGVVRSRTTSGSELWFGATHACRSTIEPVIEIRGSAGLACWSYEQESWFQPTAGRKQSHRLLSVEGARQQMIATVLERLADPTVRVCTPTMAAHHTAFIESLHEVGSIMDFDPALVDWGAAPGAATAVPLVRGLESAIRVAHATGSALCASEAVWAASA